MKKFTSILLIICIAVAFITNNGYLSSDERIETNVEKKYHIFPRKEQYGAGYKDAQIVQLKLERQQDILPVKFLLFLTFPEIKAYHPYEWVQFYECKENDKISQVKDYFITVPYPEGVVKRMDDFLNYIDGKDVGLLGNANKSKALDKLLKSLHRITDYNADWLSEDFSLPPSGAQRQCLIAGSRVCLLLNRTPIYKLVTPYTLYMSGEKNKEIRPEKRYKEFYNDLNKTYSELTEFREEEINDPKLLSLIYLIRGWICHILEKHQEAVGMFDEVVKYNIDDYVLPALFYKAMSLGASEKKTENMSNAEMCEWYYRRYKYQILLSILALDEIAQTTESKEIWEKHFKDLSKSKTTELVYHDILGKYKHLEKDRKVLFIWSKEILKGGLLSDNESE